VPRPQPPNHRKGLIHEAVAFAQGTLPAVRQCAPHLEAELQEVVALVAYQSPEVN